MRKIAIVGIVILIAYISKSCILEDRENCPAYLSLDFMNPHSDVKSVYLILSYENGLKIRDTLSREELSDYEIPVRRGTFSIAAFANIENMLYEDGYIVNIGGEADSVYTGFGEIYCDEDLCMDTVILKRDFISLHIRMLGYAEEYDSVYVSVHSSTVGYDLKGNVRYGDFRHTPEALSVPDSSRSHYEYLSRLVRQTDDDLSIKVYVVREGVEECIKSVSLPDIFTGEEVYAGEEEVYVVIDFSKSTISISVEDWNCMDYVEIEM